MDETVKDNKEECGIKEQSDEVNVFCPTLPKTEENTKECDVKGEDDAITLRPTLTKTEDNMEECDVKGEDDAINMRPTLTKTEENTEECEVKGEDDAINFRPTLTKTEENMEECDVKGEDDAITLRPTLTKTEDNTEECDVKGEDDAITLRPTLTKTEDNTEECDVKGEDDAITLRPTLTKTEENTEECEVKGEDDAITLRPTLTKTEENTEECDVKGEDDAINMRPTLTKTEENTEECEVKGEDDAITLRPTLTKTEDNTEECEVKGEDDAINLRPTLTKTEDNTEKCDKKVGQDDAIILRPTLIKTEENTEMCDKKVGQDDAIILRPTLIKTEDNTEEGDVKGEDDAIILRPTLTKTADKTETCDKKVGQDDAIIWRPTVIKTEENTEEGDVKGVDDAITSLPTLSKTKCNTEECSKNGEQVDVTNLRPKLRRKKTHEKSNDSTDYGKNRKQVDAVNLRPKLRRKKRHEIAKDNTKKCGKNGGQDDAVILRPNLRRKKRVEIAKDNTEDCSKKGDQDEAIYPQPTLKRKKSDEVVKDNTGELVNSNTLEQDENDEVTDFEESSDESVMSSVDSIEEQMFLDGLDPLLDRFSDASDQDWYPYCNPQKKKRSSRMYSVKCGGKKGGKSSTNQALPLSSEQKWKSVEEPDVEPKQPIFKPKNTPGPQLNSSATCSPLQYFELFFSKSVLQTVVEHTNAYGAMHCEGKKSPWENISIKDLKSFIGLLIYMGMTKCSKLSDYWKKSFIYSMPFPARIMSSNKFFNICAGLHLNDPKVLEENEKKRGTPEYDRLCKIKPLYQDMRDACRASFHPSQNISINERIVASNTKNILLEYMEDKPTRWGYKLFVLEDSLCGYTWDFFIYEAKVYSENSNGISYDSVMSLANEKLLGSGYKLFVDNFYTSPKLFRDLLQKKIWACGPVRANRIGHLKTVAPRGNIRWFREDDLLFVEWKDNRDVLMCSTFHKAFNGDSIKRNVKGADGIWANQDFPVPGAVLDYKKHMGGVNQSEAFTGYSTALKKNKQIWSFFNYFVDIAVVNAFILHQQMAKMKNQKPLTQKVFRETLVEELAGTINASAPVQEDLTNSHLPIFHKGDSTFGRQRCKVCSHKTPVMCTTCQLHLCFVPKRDCYNKWHDKLTEESERE
ncbi:uncharacterized protein LOC127988134 isoform X9 [Carassius gibelio]|uniref:uncharacterized protein LOC127988134 isoform X9 n=1 Tax=Carassius gibelio TaxID=101364 RepID=UPI0022781549|nr:uncharacterized protein LOC127988134 isoform X9 [Carassius gibelio]